MTHKFVILLTILGLALTACSPTTSPPPAPEREPTEEIEPTQAPPVEEPQVENQPVMVVFSDDLGRRIELRDYAQRIVTLGPSSLESLFAIGAGSQVVGREEFSTYPEEALEVTSVGSLWGEIPTEAILALEPDLVIAPEIISPEQIQTLEELGLTVYFQANPVDFPGLWQNLRNLATLSGHEAEAEALIADLEARVNLVVEAVAPLSYKPVVFYELDATDPQNPYTIGGGTIIDTIISMAGGFNMGAVLEGQYAPISSEEVITQNPEIILLADAPYGITPETVTDRAGWDAITAVKNGQMYEFDPFLVSVPGPRLVDGLEAMTQIIHPGILASDGPVSFTDDLGRQIELVVPAQRIVTLGPSSLESLFAIDAGDQVVGREEYSTYPDEAMEVTSVGSLWGELPLEAILALDPDLVIAPEIISPEQIQTLTDLGLTVYFQANPTDFGGLWKNLRTLAALTGHHAEADQLIAALDARVKAVAQVIDPILERPTVFYELDATDPQNPYTVGAGTFIDTIITLSGGTNIGQILEGAYAQISSEEVIVQNPEIILLADAPYGVTAETVAERAGWDVMDAVANGAIYEFDPFLVSVPGPRLVDGLEAMAEMIHPEAFE